MAMDRAALARLEQGLRDIRADPREWFVLEGNRLVVAGLVTLAFAAGVAVMSSAGIVTTIGPTRITYMFQALITWNVTLITIVVSINQLVLSRELNAPGELQDRIENVIEYRESVEETTDRSPLPVTPADFLTALLEGAEETARRLDETVGEHEEQYPPEVSEFTSEFSKRIERNRADVERSQSSTFSGLVTLLETDFSRELYEAYRLKTRYGDDLPPEAGDLIDEQMRSIEQIDVARQYFRSVYVQSELARLSRTLLYVGVPALFGGVLLLFTYTTAAELPLSVAALEVLIPVVVVLSFAPLAVLFSFVLRITMIAQRTVAITPFTTPGGSAGVTDERGLTEE